jgi:hypothetical protein
LRKEIKKNNRKGKGGASRPRPRFWPAGRSRPGPPAPSPSPSSCSRPRPRARTASPCRRGAPAEPGRRVAGMRRRGDALVGHQEPLDAPAEAPAPICALHSRSRLSARSRAAVTAPPHAIAADGSELLSRPAPALSFLFATTTGSASSFRVACLRSSALGKPCVSARAHRSKSELRRPLGSRGSPSPLCLCLRS